MVWGSEWASSYERIFLVGEARDAMNCGYFECFFGCHVWEN